MPRRISTSPRVRRWINAELSYLAERSLAAVRRFRERLSTMQRLLSERPRIGRAEGTSGARRLVITPYIVIYREKGEEIEIVDIRHSRQRERPIPGERVSRSEAGAPCPNAGFRA